MVTPKTTTAVLVVTPKSLGKIFGLPGKQVTHSWRQEPDMAGGRTPVTVPTALPRALRATATDIPVAKGAKKPPMREKALHRDKPKARTAVG